MQLNFAMIMANKSSCMVVYVCFQKNVSKSFRGKLEINPSIVYEKLLKRKFTWPQRKTALSGCSLSHIVTRCFLKAWGPTQTNKQTNMSVHVSICQYVSVST